MIYILTGVAKAGKTYVANMIRKEKGLSVFSSDYLMMAVAKGDPSLGLKPDSDDDEIVAKILEPFLLGMINAMAENGVEIVLEGVHFYPEFLNKLVQKHPQSIKVCILGYAEVETLKKVQELKDFLPMMENPWYAHYSDELLQQLVDFLKGVSQRLRKEAKMYQLPYVEVTDIAHQAPEIIATMFEQ